MRIRNTSIDRFNPEWDTHLMSGREELDYMNQYSGGGSTTQAAPPKPKPNIYDSIMKDLTAANSQATASIDQSLHAAAGAMAHAQMQAAAQIKAGMKAAAKATIEAAKIGAKAIMDAAELADETVREFWAKTNDILMPIIDLGGYAMDDMASMLGIPNKDGEIVPYDFNDLKEDPGYQFQLNEGQTTLQSQFSGQHLSGASTKATIEYGQNFAANRWQQRMQELGFLAQVGAQAGDTLAQQATMTGAQAAANQIRAGEMVAQLQSNKGNQLANIYTQGGIAQGQITASGGETLAGMMYGAGMEKAGLISGLATAGANIKLSMYQAQQQKKASSGGFFKKILGTVAGAATGAAVKSFMSDIRLKKDITRVGTSPDGHSIYNFRYIDGDETMYQGVMAQEVPEAAHFNPAGYWMVDYSKIDVDMREVV